VVRIHTRKVSYSKGSRNKKEGKTKETQKEKEDEADKCKGEGELMQSGGGGNPEGRVKRWNIRRRTADCLYPQSNV